MRTVAFFLFASFMALNCALAEESPNLEDLSLENLLSLKVVSVTRQEEKAFLLPGMVTVLTREQLESWGAENLADGLKQDSGIMSRKDPGNFPQYNVAIRGNTADFMNSRTLFLIDGVPVYNPNAGFDPAWIPLNMIKRVEIVKGPVSALYGANAFGGVVNIITRSGADQGERHWDTGLGGALREDVLKQKEIPSYSGMLGYGGKNDHLDYFASAQRITDNDSTATFSGETYENVFGRVSYRASDSVTLTLNSLLSVEDNQIALSNMNGPLTTDFLHLSATANVRINPSSDLRLTGYFNDFDHYYKYNDALDHYDNQGKAAGFTSQYSFALSDTHHLVTGFEYARLSGSLSTNGYNYSTFPPTPTPAGWDTKVQNAYSLFVQDEYTGWDRWSPILGVRFDDNSVFGAAFSPRAGISYSISKNLAVYTSAGRGFRAPVFNESYINGFGKVGNTSLKPEFTTTYEIGAKSAFKNVQNNLALFHEEVSDKINLVPIDPSNPNSLNTYRNGATGSNSGVEVEGSVTPIPEFRPFYSATLLSSDDGAKRSFAKSINRKVVLGTNWDLFGCEWKYILIHEGPEYFYTPDVQIPSITTMNIQIARKIGSVARLVAYVDNLTDRKYVEDFASFNLPQGSWQSGISTGLQFKASF